MKGQEKETREKNAAGKLRFGKDGLIPAVIQDDGTGEVLTLAYMNRESLEITLREGRTCFYSRSRKQLWRKGETSGNIQRVVSMTADCDGDALLVRVRKTGPACHTGEESCFFRPFPGDENSGGFSGQERGAASAEEGFPSGQAEAAAFSFEDLYRLLEERKAAPREGSYTSYLFEKGKEKILKKVGEECTEVILAAAKEDREETVYEIADLAYHLLVMMAERGIRPEDVRAELAGRRIVEHKVKQEKMK